MALIDAGVNAEALAHAVNQLKALSTNSSGGNSQSGAK